MEADAQLTTKLSDSTTVAIVEVPDFCSSTDILGGLREKTKCSCITYWNFCNGYIFCDLKTSMWYSLEQLCTKLTNLWDP